jgi:peptide deformylase
MNLKLLSEDDSKLKEVSIAWDFEVDGDPTDLVKAMAKTMFENNGIGLAAPQVGIQKRLFIMGNPDLLYTIINPTIIIKEGEIVKDLEGCLSFPNLWLKVRRSDKIIVKYYDIKGNLINTEFTGLKARVFQHEYDHLDGICFVNQVGPVALDLAKEKRRRKS